MYQLKKIRQERTEIDQARAGSLTLVFTRGTLDADSAFTPLKDTFGDIYTFEFISVKTSEPMFDRDLDAQYLCEQDPYAKAFTDGRKRLAEERRLVEEKRVKAESMREAEKQREVEANFKVEEERKAAEGRLDEETGGVLLGDFSVLSDTTTVALSNMTASTDVVIAEKQVQSSKRSREQMEDDIEMELEEIELAREEAELEYRQKALAVKRKRLAARKARMCMA